VAVAGRLGEQVSLEQGQEAARLCALNLLAQAKAACGGDLGRLARCLKLGGFVSCGPGFTDHPAVINGASDLMVQAMGEAGQHARFAVGCASLPRNAAVEVEGIFELA
jgi:enamine deaminase RidA (YjgF/YER057c/UK114 family)